MVPDPFYLMRQLAHLMPDPTKTFSGRKKRPTAVPTGDRCGLCPLCREVVYLAGPESDAADTCPRCGGMFDELDPIGLP